MEQLQQLSHIKTADLGDRALNMMPLWDGEIWHSWITIDGKVTPFKVAGVVEGDYLATAPQTSSDLFFPFVDLMWQRASWPEIVPLITAIEKDFLKMGTSIAKLKHIHRTRKLSTDGAARAFASTELEYLVILCRTVFDLTQELLARVWNGRVKLLDPELERVRKQHKLNETFSKVCLKEDTIRTSEELRQTYALPQQMADQYVRAAPFFLELRKFRNGIVHSGTPLCFLFDTERGFCIDKGSYMLKAVPCAFTHEYNDNLVSILPWLAELIVQTTTRCTSLVNAFASVIPLPEPIAPGYRVFTKAPNNDALLEVLAVHEGASPWWD